MTRRRVRARNASAARRKASSRHVVVTSVNYIPGTLRGGMKTYAIITKRKSR